MLVVASEVPCTRVGRAAEERTMKKQPKKEAKQSRLADQDLAKVIGGAGGGYSGSPVHPSGPGG